MQVLVQQQWRECSGQQCFTATRSLATLTSMRTLLAAWRTRQGEGGGEGGRDGVSESVSEGTSSERASGWVGV